MNERPSEVSPRVHLMSGLLGGGAANAAKRLLGGLREEGVEAQLLYPPKLKLQSDVIEPGIRRLQWNVGGWDRMSRSVQFRIHRESFKRKVRGRAPGQEIFTSPRGAPYTPWPPTGVRPQAGDILHLHWISKFVDYTSFFESIPNSVPVVWTLHDMNPFTGGCHFTEGCRQFTTGCGNCPQLPRPDADDISRQFFQIKRQALQGVDLHVVTVSRWMMEQAKQSPVFDHVKSFHRIPYGLALDEFQPKDRKEARAELGLDPDAFVFSFGAADIENRRKGFGLLLESLEAIADVPGATGLVFGGGDLPQVEHSIPELRSMGFIASVERMMTIYAASDVFILPSTEDNLPLTCLESLASGTPVLAFEAGGVPDMVRPRETGWLAPNGDRAALGQQLRYITEHPEEVERFGTTARKVALDEYSRQREAKAYAKLYATLLDASKDAA
ncbi:MAG: glycosyltransferase [Rubripirellula sp.]